MSRRMRRNVLSVLVATGVSVVLANIFLTPLLPGFLQLPDLERLAVILFLISFGFIIGCLWRR